MKKVLLTSSSRAFLGRNENLLKDKGFHLFTAATGVEALKLHQQHPFDLILSDLELDDMDGCSLCHAVSTTGPSRRIPMVLICYDNFESIEKVRQSTASAMLLRPINPSQLLVTIGSFIDMQLARSKRVEFRSNVISKKQDKEFICISHDISVTGILLETEQQLSLGDQISCQFKMYDSCPPMAAGEVTRCFRSPQGKNLYGIKFTELPLPKRSAIEKYVASNNHLGIRQKTHYLPAARP